MEVFKNLKSFLFIGAHFDDLEIACGGTIKRLCDYNKNVFGLVITDTHYKRHNKILRDNKTCTAEGNDAASVLGYNLISKNYHLNDVPYNSKLIYEIRDIIEEKKIETVFTHWDQDIHQDHRNIALATLSATRHVNNVFMYKSNYYDTSRFFLTNFYVDISDVINYKIKALKCFRSEFERKGEGWIDYVIYNDKLNGIKNNIEYAENFSLVKLCI